MAVSAKYKFLPIKTKLPLTIVLYVMMSFYAMSLTMMGPAMPVIIDEYSLTLSGGGFIVTLSSIGGFLAILIGSISVDRVKKGVLVGLSFLVFGVSLAVLGMKPSFALILVVFFVIGASSRMLDTILNAHVADLHTERRALTINLLHTFFSLGALIGPLYARIVITDNSWTSAFYKLGLICITLFILYLPVSHLTKKTSLISNTPSQHDYGSLLKNRTMWVLCVITFLYSGHQAVSTIWLPMYMARQLNATDFFSSLSLSLLWLGIIIGRLFASFYSKKIGLKNSIVWGSVLGGSVILLSLITGSPVVIAISFTLAGVFTGAVVPLIIVIACSAFPKNSGTASAMIILSVTVGVMVCPWFAGFLAENFGLPAGFIIAGAPLLAVYPLRKHIILQ